jgi:ectoine hydroxylase-related dioxygenase (phytanoyl-CoA dioxygenase family)
MTLYTGNTMLPGTTQMQPVHWDEGQLWAGLDAPSPAHSLTINVPLVDVTEENGAIEVWPGSHLDVRTGGRSSIHVPEEWLAERQSIRVPTSKGSILLRDGRMWHRGTTNSTSSPRPMIAVVYAASWFRPLPIDVHADCEPVLRDAGVRVLARYRDDVDELAWPPDWRIVPG